MDPEQPAQEERKRMYKQQKHSTFPPEAEPSKQQTAAEQTLKLNADSHPNNDACLGLKHRKNIYAMPITCSTLTRKIYLDKSECIA